MYSREKRMKAIKLYIKYDKGTADVIRELGYPNPKSLRAWFKVYLKEQETGVEVRTFSWTNYTAIPRLILYSMGLIAPSEIFILFSLYQYKYSFRILMNSSILTSFQSL